MTIQRIELMPGVHLTAVRTDKFKSSRWSLRLLSPLRPETASLNAVLPYVLRRGTARLPDQAALSAELDELCGVIEPAVSQRGDVQCVGFEASFSDQVNAGADTPVLERSAALLGELLLHPATKNGRLRQDYVRSEKENLLRRIDGEDGGSAWFAEKLFSGQGCAAGRLGTRAQAAKITLTRLYPQYQTLLERAPVELYYCGSAPARRVELACREALMGLPRSGERYSIETDARRREQTQIREFARRLDFGPSRLELAYRTGFGLSDPQFPALLVVRALFDAASALDGVKGLLLVSCAGEPERFDELQGELVGRLERLQRGAFSAEEFQTARQAVVHSLSSALDDQDRLCGQWLWDAAAGEPFDPERLIAQVREVTGGQAGAAAMELVLDSVCRLSAPEGGEGHEGA